MKTWASLIAVACVAAAAGVTFVFAQPPAAPPPPAVAAPPPGTPPPALGTAKGAEHPSGKEAGGFGGMMEDKELREMVETVMMAKLSTRLGLTDEQALQLVRQRSKTREETQRLMKERRDKMKALDAAAKGDKPDDADVNAKLNDLMALDEKLASMRRQGIEESSKNLTAVQRAKLYMFVNEFENDMRQLINRARGKFGGPGGMGPGGMGPDALREGGPGQREGMQGIREQFRENIRKNLREGGLRPGRLGEIRPGQEGNTDGRDVKVPPPPAPPASEK